MAGDFPYTQAWSRLSDIFTSIGTAGTPPKFNNEFLKSTLGFTSSNDRSIIPILRTLGFISPGGEPTQRYNDFKGHDGGRALAAGLREGWAQLFCRFRNCAADDDLSTSEFVKFHSRWRTQFSALRGGS
jgi:uncharacterized protein DUF5343